VAVVTSTDSGSVHDDAPSAIIVTDQDATIRFTDDALCRWFGFRPGKLAGSLLAEIIPEFAAVQQDGVWVPVRMAPGTSSAREVLIHRVPISDGSGPALTLWRISPLPVAHPDSGELYEQIVAAASDAVITKTLDGVVTTWNPGATALYGYTADRMIGASASLLFPPEMQDEEVAILKRVGRGEKVEHHRIVRCRAGGARVVVELTATPLRDRAARICGILTVSTDVTERVHAEDQFRNLLEAAPDGIIGYTRSGRIVYANTLAERLLGYPPSALIDRQVDDLVPQHQRPGAVLLREAQFNEPDHHTVGVDTPVWAQRRDGSTFPVEVSMSPIHTDDGTVVLAALRDRTPWMAMQAHLARLAETTPDGPATPGEQAVAYGNLGRLVGGIAHDFNNLLAVISHHAQFVVESAESAEAGPASYGAARDAAKILNASRRGAELSKALHGIARPGSDQPETIDLEELAASVTAVAAGTASGRIRVRTFLGPGTPPVQAVRSRIEQCLLNLILNARDSMPDGGSLTVEITAADVGPDFDHRSGPVPRRGRHAVLRVTDTGSGMPQDVAARAFDPFFTTKGPGHGAGLGLSMVYAFTADHQGTVLLDTSPTGTTVTVLIPVADGGTPAPETDIPDRAGARILLVEGVDDLRESCRRTLTTAGYVVVGHTDPVTALDDAIASDDPYDVIITNTSYPAMPGRDLVDRVKARHPGIRVLYVTGHRHLVVAGAETTTGDRGLQKPFTPRQLLQSVAALTSG
jgi:two-component system cell cycle sensor histidine kinase/response regulator CckA